MAKAKTQSNPERVYLLKNGAIIHNGQMLVRIVYASDETAEVILNALRKHYGDRTDEIRGSD